MDDLSQAFECYSQAASILSLSNQDPLQLATFFTNFAKSCAMSKPKLAEEKLMQTLQLCEKTGDQLVVHAANKDLATFFYEQKRYACAVEICQTVERQVTKSFGMPGSAMCFAINAVKVSRLFIQCLKEMREYQTAIDKSKLLFDDTNKETAMALTVASGRSILGDVMMCVGDCLLAERLVSDALSHYIEALHLYENSVGKEDPKMIAGLVTLAQLCLTGESPIPSMDERFLNSADALMKVTKRSELVEGHAEDVHNLVDFFSSGGFKAAAQLALEVSMAVFEYVKHGTTASADDDLLPEWNFPGQQQPQTGSSSLTAFPSSHKVASTQAVSSSELSEQSSSMSCSIKLLPIEEIRDLLIWSCIPRLLVPVEEDGSEST